MDVGVLIIREDLGNLRFFVICRGRLRGLVRRMTRIQDKAIAVQIRKTVCADKHKRLNMWYNIINRKTPSRGPLGTPC